jgi:hypothetical protein
MPDRPPVVYLSARYDRRSELAHYADDLEAIGYEVQARWLTNEDISVDPLSPIDEQQRIYGELAKEDVDDVMAADLVLCFTENPEKTGYTRGGRHVELGIALGQGKVIFLVGPRENVFHWLPGVVHYPDWISARADLSALLRLSPICGRLAEGRL